MDAFNPKLASFRNTCAWAELMICFGQPAHILYNMLPVTQPGSRFNEKRLEIISKPQQLVLTGEGPWKNFKPENGPLHYALRIDAKPGAKVLAEWGDGTPAVVSGTFGKGKVIYIGTGSGQVWQDKPRWKVWMNWLFGYFMTLKEGNRQLKQCSKKPKICSMRKERKNLQPGILCLQTSS
jgi:hypothetical protein